MPPSREPSRRLAARARLARLRRVQRARTQRTSERTNHRRHPFVIAAAVLAILGVVAVYGGTQVGLSLLDATAGNLSNPRQFASDSFVMDRAGVVIAELHPNGDTRIPVPLTQVSTLLVDATVAVEDRNFWTEGAMDPPRIISAAVQDLQHGSASQGASTITQQLAKVLYLTDTKALSRKIRELAIARHLDQTESKQQILGDYLNDIYYGQGATGIEAAARVYFAVDSHNLDLAESALLAGLPNEPTNLDPVQHLDAAKARQRQVLEAMVTARDITQAQADQAYAEPLPLQTTSIDDIDAYPAFTQRVVAEVQQRTKMDPYTAGLTIYTTLDQTRQRVAQATVTANVNRVADLHVTDGALVSIDPQTGEVLAYVGSAGPGHPGWQIDMASSPRQPGSTFKIFTYTTAIGSRVMTMTSPILDAPYTLPTGGGPFGMLPYPISNYDFRYHGVLPAEEDLGNSFNIPAVKVELLAGIVNVLHMARSMGVTTLTAPDSSYGASMTLGSYSVPLWEMAQAGTVLATGGVLHPAHFVRDVRGPSGKSIWPGAPASKQILDPGLAYIMNTVLSDDTNRTMEFGTGSDLTVAGHRVAAKTGTSQDFRDNLTDGWTPHLATAVWVGNADNSPMRGTTGITGAAPAFHTYMSTFLRGQQDGWPAMPSDLHEAYAYGKPAYYLPGTSPAGPAVGPCAPQTWSTRGYANNYGSPPAGLGDNGTGFGYGYPRAFPTYVPLTCPLMSGAPVTSNGTPITGGRPGSPPPPPPPVGAPPPPPPHHKKK